jgi:uncharacterized protein DUF4349
MRTPFMARRPGLARIVAVLVALLILGACGAGAEKSISSHAPAGAPAAPNDQFSSSRQSRAGIGGSTSGDVAQSSSGGGSGSKAAPAPAAVAPALPDKIIKTADLGLEVKDGSFDDAWIRAFQTATRFGGYVASSNRGRPQPLGAERSDRERAFGDITIRVPVARFEPALNELRKIGKVTGDVSNSEDVTDQYVDLQSRIRHQRAQETVLVKLMGRARSIQDTLVVQNELSKVQLQIEELTGKLNALAGRTDLSTITVHLAEKGAAVATSKTNGDGPSFSKAWDTAVVGLKRIATAFVIVVPLITPFLLLGALSWFLVRRRWAKAHRTAPAEA